MAGAARVCSYPRNCLDDYPELDRNILINIRIIQVRLTLKDESLTCTPRGGCPRWRRRSEVVIHDMREEDL